jgi:hypothetical protein
MYSVKYRKHGAIFWHKLRNVKGDLTLAKEGLAVRVFILEDETRIEIPALTSEIIFSKERHATILKKLESEAGQKLAIN